MHGDRLAEYYGGIGNFVYTRATVPEYLWAQFIVREDSRIQLEERLAFAVMFGMSVSTHRLLIFIVSATVQQWS